MEMTREQALSFFKDIPIKDFFFIVNLETKQHHLRFKEDDSNFTSPLDGCWDHIDWCENDNFVEWYYFSKLPANKQAELKKQLKDLPPTFIQKKIDHPDDAYGEYIAILEDGRFKFCVNYTNDPDVYVNVETGDTYDIVELEKAILFSIGSENQDKVKKLFTDIENEYSLVIEPIEEVEPDTSIMAILKDVQRALNELPKQQYSSIIEDDYSDTYKLASKVDKVINENKALVGFDVVEEHNGYKLLIKEVTGHAAYCYIIQNSYGEDLSMQFEYMYAKPDFDYFAKGIPQEYLK